ncbi:hypothetical protein H2248_008319 [Termitomyces sp. 'cryptogamus']|nr:hypothetical protein H2248_008319 [Termitomyces sp. 'cryptogamus']
MSSSTVYLEDVETNVNDTRSVETRQEDRPPSSPAPSSTPSLTKFANASQGSGSNIKRQRTLVDMFTGSQGKSSLTDEPSVKKLKLTPSGSSMSSSSSIKSDGLKIFGLQKLNSIPFSMSEYLETLTDDQKRLLRLECEVMGKSWLKLLKDEIKKPYFIALKQFLWDEGVRGPDDSSAKLKIYPAPKNIYAWSNTPLGKVKVVILGQDPYYQRGQAHGLCFSVPTGVVVPPSLRNVRVFLISCFFRPPDILVFLFLHTGGLEDLHRTQGRVSGVRDPESWKSHSMGPKWCPYAQHLSHRPRGGSRVSS